LRRWDLDDQKLITAVTPVRTFRTCGFVWFDGSKETTRIAAQVGLAAHLAGLSNCSAVRKRRGPWDLSA